jgi:hypothetical protein
MTKQTSPEWSSFKNIVASVQREIDLEHIKLEVETIQRQRPSRKLYTYKKSGGMADTKRIWDALEFELQARTRLVELASKVHFQLDVLDTTISTVSDWLISAYYSDLKIADRKIQVHNKTRGSRTLLSELKSLASNIDRVIEDIDKAGYAFRNIVELVKLLDESRKSKIV